jgi:hypothetical protein
MESVWYWWLVVLVNMPPRAGSKSESEVQRRWMYCLKHHTTRSGLATFVDCSQRTPLGDRQRPDILLVEATSTSTAYGYANAVAVIELKASLGSDVQRTTFHQAVGQTVSRCLAIFEAQPDRTSCVVIVGDGSKFHVCDFHQAESSYALKISQEFKLEHCMYISTVDACISM